MSAHESMEHAEHAEHATGHNRQIALLIAVLALFLAFSETLGKSAQTNSLTLNIKSSDTWSFFQAKTIRQTVLRTAAEQASVAAQPAPGDDGKAALIKQIDAWKATVARYESDPKEKDGRKELREAAEGYEHARDLALERYHHYEFASAAFQIAIVLASATIITGIVTLAWMSCGLGLIGLGLVAVGLFAPHLIHLG